MDTSKQQASNEKNREGTKKSSLSLAYEKLDKFISKIHGILLHNGGSSRVKDVWSKLINGTFLDGLQSLRRKIIVDSLESLIMDKYSRLFYSWAH